MDKNKVFVTGADGMLGSSITRELLKQGYEVKALVMPERKINVLDNLNIEKVTGDILDKTFLENVMNDCSYVIHVAAMTNVYPARSEKVTKVNVLGTKNVMEVAEKFNYLRMVHIGTANSFEEGTKEKPGDENSPFTANKFGLDYIDSKYQAQKLLIENFKKKEFPVIIVNPTYMIGPFDSGPSSGKMLMELYKQKMPGYSNGGKNFVCSFDVAIAAANALKMGRIGECYIAGGENLEYEEFFRRACNLWNIKFKLKKVPSFLIESLGAVNSVFASFFRFTPKLSFRMAKMASIYQFYSPKKAQQELKMPQTPIEQGIEQCISWFKQNNYLND